MTEFRCKKCNKLLAKVEGGKLEIKCPRCGHINKEPQAKATGLLR